jgi:hypothetical protein
MPSSDDFDDFQAFEAAPGPSSDITDGTESSLVASGPGTVAVERSVTATGARVEPAAAPTSAAPPPAPKTAAEAPGGVEEDEFGDFGEAEAAPAQGAAFATALTPPAAAAPPPPPAAVAAGPDITHLEGRPFIEAVLSAWEVRGPWRRWGQTGEGRPSGASG